MNKLTLKYQQEEQSLRACFHLLGSILVEITEGPNEIDEERLSSELWFIIQQGEQALNNVFSSEDKEVNESE